MEKLYRLIGLLLDYLIWVATKKIKKLLTKYFTLNFPSGLEKGDRVAIWSPNYEFWYISMLAIARAGLICVKLSSSCNLVKISEHRKGFLLVILGRSQSRISIT
jgi:acyl-CoA synthetase (AMP-forming)/AMP-acid ligase II